MAQGNLSEDEEFELLSLQREKAGIPAQTFQQQMPGIAQQAGQAALASSPANLTKNFMQTDPATMQRVGGGALPIMGAALTGPFAPIGAAGGELLRQATGTVLAPDTVPKTGLGRFGSVMAAGVAEEPKALDLIPGAPQAKQVLSNVAAKFGKGMARAGETLSGVKKDVLKQAYEKGFSAYGAPSLPKAQQIFGQALGPEGQAAMRQGAAEAFDPALGKAREIATQIGAKIEKGQPVTAIEALKARQATDRVISATPITDKVSRKALYGWRNQFDNELASQSGKLADASRTYRNAIIKDKITNLTRMNKSGEPSAFLPMIVGHSMAGKGLEGGLGMLTGTSPAVWGLGAAAAGQAAKGLNAIGQNPAARQVLLQVLQKINAAKAQQGPPPVMGIRG